MITNDQRAEAATALNHASRDFHAAYWMWGDPQMQTAVTAMAMDALVRGINALGYQLIKIEPEASMGTTNIEEQNERRGNIRDESGESASDQRDFSRPF